MPKLCTHQVRAQVRAQRGGGRPQPRKGVLARAWPSWHPGLGPAASRATGTEASAVDAPAPSAVLCYGSPPPWTPAHPLFFLLQTLSKKINTGVNVFKARTAATLERVEPSLKEEAVLRDHGITRHGS